MATLQHVFVLTCAAAIAGCAGIKEPPVLVLIRTNPAPPIYANEWPVQFEVVPMTPNGAPPDQVLFSAEGRPYARMRAPYRYHWHATTRPEGTYRFQARVEFRGVWAESSPVDVVVDRTPPRVVSVSPQPGATVPATEPIEVTFSEPIYRDDTLPDFRVWRKSLGSSVPCTVDAHTPRPPHIRRVIPTTPFASPDELRVEIERATFRDRAGNLLVDPPSWTYFVDSPWELVGGGSPAPDAHSDTRRPSLFVLRNELHVSSAAGIVSKLAPQGWLQVTDAADVAGPFGTDGTSIWTATTAPRRWTGSRWDDPVPAAPIPVHDAFQLFLEPTGFTAVSFKSDRDGSSIFAAKWTGAGWTTTPTLQLEGTAYFGGASLFNGVAHVLFSQPPTVRVVRLESAGFVPLPGSMPGGNLWQWAAIGPDLTVVTPGRDSSLASWQPDATGWRDTGVVLYGIRKAPSPAVAVSVDAARYVAFKDRTLIRVKRWDAGAWLEPWGVLNVDPEAVVTAPALAFDADGAAVVAWSERDSATARFNTFVKRLRR